MSKTFDVFFGTLITVTSYAMVIGLAIWGSVTTFEPATIGGLAFFAWLAGVSSILLIIAAFEEEKTLDEKVLEENLVR